MSTIQSLLFERALHEEGIEKKGFNINHAKPENYNNGVTYNMIFPKSFLKDLESLNYEKKLDYIFLGTISGPHREFLKTWDKPNSIIKTTLQNKFVHPKNHQGFYPDNLFNRDYFQDLASSKFTLAPGGCSAMDPKYKEKQLFLWTYRFWEACLTRSIPITNEPDPKWHGDYKFYSLEDEHVYREDWVEHNFNLVKERHFIW